MTLTSFLQSLYAEGKVMATGELAAFNPGDRKAAEQVLQEFYRADALEMPGRAPDFHAEAALQAATYLYNAVQLIIHRDLDDAAVEKHLTGLPTPKTPEVIYSADLTLRYLPELFFLAKGLSPQDVVVAKLLQTAAQWPFSSVGIFPEGDYDLKNILAHQSLKYAYADRILAKKDKIRAHHPQMIDLIRERLGAFAPDLWPDWEPILSPINQ